MPPNVLWICTDQQRYDTLGCYGNGFVETPNIDRLAEEGVRFERCFSQSPVCTPSRASFLTGRYPRTTRCRANGQPIPEDEPLVTGRLADAGYTCGLAGKLHLSPCNPAAPGPPTERRIDDGYAEFHWSHHPGPDWPTNEYVHWLRDRGVDLSEYLYTDEGTGARRFDRSPALEDAPDSEYVRIGPPPEHHQTTWCAEKAINFVEANADADAPWLFSVNPFDPHHAFDPPIEYLRRYLDDLGAVPLPEYEPGELADKPVFQRRDHEGAYNTEGNFPFGEMSERDHRLVRAAYWAMVDLIDHQVGRLLDALDRTGQREDTVVIFTSDHGEMLGDHGIYLKGPYFYEEAIRVPLIVAGPGIEAGRETDALVELVDLAPTLAAAAGLDRHEGVQGRSLWPLLTGEADEHRESVYCEYYDAMPWHSDPAARATMVRTAEHKLIEVHGLDQGELYDLGEGETENRWSDPAYEAVKSDLRGDLVDRMAGTVDPLPERAADW